MAEGTSVLPIQAIVLVHVDSAGIVLVRIVKFGTDGNPISIGCQRFSCSEFRTAAWGWNHRFQGPGTVTRLAENFDVLIVICSDQHLTVHGHGRAEIQISALLRAGQFVMDVKHLGVPGRSLSLGCGKEQTGESNHTEDGGKTIQA